MLQGTVRPLDVIRAVAELAAARIFLNKFSSAEAMEEPADALRALGAAELQVVDRIAYVVPRIAARLPWRADCLVQALAAKRWLESRGISSRIYLGVNENQFDGIEFEAHAWLSAGGHIVTGGDISRCHVFKQPADTNSSRQSDDFRNDRSGIARMTPRARRLRETRSGCSQRGPIQ